MSDPFIPFTTDDVARPCYEGQAKLSPKCSKGRFGAGGIRVRARRFCRRQPVVLVFHQAGSRAERIGPRRAALDR